MYYEEQTINGKVYYRTTPTGGWILKIDAIMTIQKTDDVVGLRVKNCPSWPEIKTVYKHRPVVGDYGDQDSVIEDECKYVRADLYDQLKQERDDIAVKFGDIGRACKIAMDERDRYRRALDEIQEACEPGHPIYRICSEAINHTPRGDGGGG